MEQENRTDWFKNPKVKKQVLRVIMDKFFILDIERTRQRVNEIEELIQKGDKKKACNEMFFFVEERGKNLYERATALRLALKDKESLFIKFNTDNQQVEDFINKSEELSDYSINPMFMEYHDFDKYKKEDIPRYSMTYHSEEKDRELLFFANATQHANIFLSEFIWEEGMVFHNKYLELKDILERVEQVIGEILEKVTDRIGDIDGLDYKRVWYLYKREDN